jgi:hypothetical protein
VGAAELGRPTLMFLTKEAARLAVAGVATAVACDGCPPLADLVDRYAQGGRPVPGLPDLLRRAQAGQEPADRAGRTGRHCADVAMDRRRRGDDF